MLGLAERMRCRPSTLFDISDPYTAYCFDEACAYIKARLDNGDEPVFEQKFTSFTELYKHYGV